MPTPFYHLSIAEALLAHPDLPPALGDILRRHRAEFLLGNTAPDVQTVSGQSRETTHFFALPLRLDAQQPWQRLLEQYPALAQPGESTAKQVFLSGYLCHLQADWLWVRDIFAPTFGPFCRWATFSRRLYLHNVLRAYLDLQVVRTLPADVGRAIQTARPAGWLPFVADGCLRAWRDYLAAQLQPGAVVQTVEIFAAQQKIEPSRFYELLQSEARMNEEIFSRLPRPHLERYRQHLIRENLLLLQDYLLAAAMPATLRLSVPSMASSVERPL